MTAADALVRRAGEWTAAGDLDRAAADLDEAAAIHRAAGSVLEEARATAAAATTLRLAGRIDEALARAGRAAVLAAPATPVRVSALTELGELRILHGCPDDAIAAYREALDHGRRIGLLPFAQSALLRRIAQALALAGRPADAEPVLREAVGLYVAAGRDADARQTRVEAAVALATAGRPAEDAIAAARAAAVAADDDGALAELALVDAAVAISASAIDAAIDHLRAARRHALDAGAPLPYVTAAVTLAQLLDDRGDRTGAYDSLAVGWVTAGDVLGHDAAAALFRPRLEALRDRWGAAEFVRVKDAYYAARRR